jgi:hypothetical protein
LLNDFDDLAGRQLRLHGKQVCWQLRLLYRPRTNQIRRDRSERSLGNSSQSRDIQVGRRNGLLGNLAMDDLRYLLRDERRCGDSHRKGRHQ